MKKINLESVAQIVHKFFVEHKKQMTPKEAESFLIALRCIVSWQKIIDGFRTDIQMYRNGDNLDQCKADTINDDLDIIVDTLKMINEKQDELERKE